jgi:hypothetical protein
VGRLGGFSPLNESRQWTELQALLIRHHPPRPRSHCSGRSSVSKRAAGTGCATTSSVSITSSIVAETPQVSVG